MWGAQKAKGNTSGFGPSSPVAVTTTFGGGFGQPTALGGGCESAAAFVKGMEVQVVGGKNQGKRGTIDHEGLFGGTWYVEIDGKSNPESTENLVKSSSAAQTTTKGSLHGEPSEGAPAELGAAAKSKTADSKMFTCRGDTRGAICSRLPSASRRLCCQLPSKPKKAPTNDTAGILTDPKVEYRSILEKNLIQVAGGQRIVWTWEKLEKPAVVPLPPPPPPPRGVLVDQPMTILDGWTKHYDEPFSKPLDSTGSQLKPPAGANWVAFGAVNKATGKIVVIAFGQVSEVFKETKQNSTTEHNGVFWYCQHSNAVGFAPNGKVSLGNADTADSSDKQRLSLHLSNSGGWRAGANTGLSDSAAYNKIVYYDSRNESASAATPGGKLVVNGDFDQKTIEALQTFLNNHWSEAGWRSQHLAVDGNLQNGFGPSSIKALQTFLNHQHITATDVHRKVVYLSICLSRGSCSVVATD